MSDQETGNQVELGDRVKGQIELPSLDITPYIGRDAVIESVTEHEGDFGFYVKFQTGVIETIGEGENKIELRASKIIGLQQDEDGNIGWGEKTKMGAWLKKNKLKHYRDAKGMKVKCQSVTNSETGKDYLTFN